MNARMIFSAMACLLALSVQVPADELLVPGTYPTIQAAVDAAVDGDLVIVADGVYTGTGNKNIDFAGRAITVRSENGAVFTTIDCENDGPAFYFHNGENQNSTVEGFTITKGSSFYNGGGINFENSSPTITECIFSGNSAKYNGGAMHVYLSSPVIEDCVFKDNRAGNHAGGAYFRSSEALVIGCVFIGNVCYNPSADGGAILSYDDISPTIVNCVFVENSADESGGAIRNASSSPNIINCTFSRNSSQFGGAICNAPDSSPIITNCILWGNNASTGDEIDNNGDCHPTISYCDIDGGWNGPKVVNRGGSSVIDGGGNIDAEPLLAPDGYHLEYGSPCINTGDPSGDYNGQTDIDGEPRVMEGRVDIGTDEYVPKTPVALEIVGPEEVAENFKASYKAIVYYDDDSMRDVTRWAGWSVEPGAIASIEAGLLTTKDIINDQAATILASYTEEDVTVDAEKAINVFAICPTGAALSFDGMDDYVDCGSDTSLDVTELTWSLWIKRAETTYTNERTLISNEGGGENTKGTYALQIDVSGQRQDKIQFVRHGDSTWPISNTAISDTNWHHIAVTRNNNGDAIIYIDGVPDSTDTIGTRTAFVKTVIGAGHTAYSNFYGTIDEVAIYHRALSGEEIWASMHTRLQGDEPGLVAYWDFDEGEGQILYDLSGNGNDGQLGSTPDVDGSDPAWIESDAPIGRCNPYLIATAAAKKALEHKRASLKELEAALAEEWTMYEALGQWLDEGDFGDLSKGDIVKAQQKSHSAMQHEEQSIDMLGKGFGKLLDSLTALGYGPQPPGSNWPPNVTITRPQNGAEFNPDDTIEIEADAWDYDGSVVIVEFFSNGNTMGEDNDGADGWTINWYDHPEGTYNLTARATDNTGAAMTSAAVGITVVEEAPPPPPPPPP